jgi:hypothetical protein
MLNALSGKKQPWRGRKYLSCLYCSLAANDFSLSDPILMWLWNIPAHEATIVIQDTQRAESISHAAMLGL